MNRRALSSFFSNPEKLFWAFIVLNLIPSILLVFTEPLNWAGKLILILFGLGLYLFLLSLSKNIGRTQVILFPLFILHAFQIVLMYLFGEAVIAVDMFLNVLTTNASEAGEVLNSLWPSIIFVVILYVPATVVAINQWRHKRYLDIGFRRKTLAIGIILILSTYGLSFFAKNVNTQKYSYHEDVYPLNILYNLDFAINKWSKTRNYPATCQGFRYNAKRDSIVPQREIYVMVIGETSRADNWSLYGYGRKTTPLLEQENNLVYFPDALTQSNTTHKSVSIMLSAASAESYNKIYEHKSIITAFKEVGFTTVFLSNQGLNHSFTEYFSREADINRNIRSVGDLGIKTVNSYDEALMPMFNHYIDSIPGNIFMVVHTYGSHFNYKERYYEEFSVFKPDNVTGIRKGDKDRLVNAYDNTILYTDYFLSSMIASLKRTEAASTMFFASDHGEDLLDDSRMRFLHASPNPTYYQLKIPMFVWFSDSYKTVFPSKVEALLNNKDKPVATNAIFHTLIDIASVNTDYLDKDLSLADVHFKTTKRMYLNDHDKPVFFYNANLKRQDKEMIEKRKVYH